jgi:seryl-tRNA synthetase
MTYARITLSERLGEEDVAQIETTLRRSFDLEDMKQTMDGLEITVRDETPVSNLQLMLKRIVRARRYADSDTLFVRSVSPNEGIDPQPALEAKGDVRQIAPGLFVFRGDFLRVRTALDVKIRTVAAKHDAVELACPALWPISVLQSIDYFHDFPQLPLLVSGVERSFEARDLFAERFRKGTERNVIACTAENGVGPAHNVLAPTVCDCCYWLLRGQRNVSDQIFTMHGHVFRNESSSEDRLDRLTAYTMREIVMVGSPAFVLSHRDALIDDMSVLISSLDLACDIKAADDPFFCNDSLKKNIIQSLNKLKYEVEVPLFAGERTAVASINLHNEFFSRNYDYEHGGSYLYSACVGFGYERLAYAMFCRHGADITDWPVPILAFLELK